ncbi:MAG: UDP-N-acetylglucosamine 2-epimerase (non-hydrolyzing) [Candidatus Coatesbacteria bacterium]|nr:UDP-N-acetylglucosamine 2-epimerase (non-hydrolyzing) [Candidatus Coatesbacteria bacterium]
MSKTKFAFVLGTRPEAIKLAPVILESLKREKQLDTIIITTGQHKSMLEQILELFKIIPDHDLKIMQHNQNLASVTSKAISGLYKVFEDEKPDLVIVQGDTTSTFCGALTAFYKKIPVAHVEAGLRTFNKYHPFPEEINRKIVGSISDFNFAPTYRAKQNLLAEGIEDSKIWVTGNTGIDALFAVMKIKHEISKQISVIFKRKKRTILVTAHRRENHGRPLKEICKALSNMLKKFKDIQILFPAHLSPNVQKTVKEHFKSTERIIILPPLNYSDFVFAMKNSYIILTDSGGIQEEAPSLGKPVLVLRETTERPEALEAGTVKLTGTDSRKILDAVSELLQNKQEYLAMTSKSNPFGDGTSSEKIIDLLNNIFNKHKG